MDWTEGYASDVEYTAGFYREQSPSHLNFACVLNGYEPVPLDQPFTYFELGFGRGLTVNILAASNPQGRFYAADFNPSHVAGARQLATEAKLDNLTLLENSFEELAQGKVQDLPQFDFITLHGIYTWVTDENQRHIVNFISRYLKPGGIVYVSYNAMPGWSAALPLQRLLVEHADLYPNRSDVQIKRAGDFVEQLVKVQAGYFTANASLKPRLESLKSANPHYLVHEYMHHHWQPVYHADVARDFAAAKLEFAGSADFPFAYPDLYLTSDKQALLQDISDTTVRETMKDYFLNTGFRKDIFIRGPRRMNAIRQWEWLSQVGVALLVPRADVKLKMKFGPGEINGKPEIYGPVIDALAVRPHTLAELSSLPVLAGQITTNIAQIAAILSGSGQATIYFAGRTDDQAAHSLNRTLSAYTRFGDDYQALASPLLGNGISMSYLERLVFYVITQDHGAANSGILVERAWKLMKKQGRCMTRDGKRLETDSENLVELEKTIDRIKEQRIPNWRQLRLL